MQATTYITDEHGKKISAVIPIKKYQQLLDEVEELEDIRMYDDVKSRNEERVSFDQYLKQRSKKKDA